MPRTTALLQDPTLDELAPAAPTLPAAMLTDIALGLAAAAPLWREVVAPAPDRRTFARLVATDAYEAWLITWPAGHGVDFHDHGGSTGLVAVAEGALLEVELDADGAVHQQTVAAGETFTVPADRVHDVINAGTVPAVSVHVYSPPLRSMTFYEAADRRPRRTEYLYPDDPGTPPPTGDGTQVARALHPARGGRRPDPR